jgi:hypothetical protein
MQEFQDLVQEFWSSQNLAANPGDLHLKLQALRKEIIKWKKEKIGDINSQEELYKITLSWLDIQKESSLNMAMMNELIERYKNMAMIKEIIWRQRAKRQWFDEGIKIWNIFTQW